MPSCSPRPRGDAPVWTAVILAGGASRRWGGADKTALPLAGTPMLARVARAVLPGPAALIVVGPPQHPARALVQQAASAAGCRLAWTCEQPRGGGPSAGLAAGLTALASVTGLAPAAGRIVVVLAADLPFAGPAVPRLLAALPPDADANAEVEAAVGLDPTGHRQPLLAAYRESPLRAGLAGAVAGRPLRELLGKLRVVEVPVTDHEALDLDTAVDAERAERLLAGPT